MHARILQDLQLFHHIDSEGVDRGISVRERARQVHDLMMDTPRLREERKKAKANRGKYTTAISNTPGVGMSGTGRYVGFGSDSFRKPSENVFHDRSQPYYSPSGIFLPIHQFNAAPNGL